MNSKTLILTNQTILDIRQCNHIRVLEYLTSTVFFEKPILANKRVPKIRDTNSVFLITFESTNLQK